MISPLCDLAGYVLSPDANYGPLEAKEKTMNKESSKKTTTKKAAADLAVKNAAAVAGGLNFTKIEYKH